MRRLLSVLVVVIVGLVTSVALSSAVIGYDDTILSLNVFGRRSISIVDPPTRTLTQADIASSQSVLGLSEYQYNDLELDSNIKEVQTELVSAPFTIPTNGIAGHQNFLYLPPVHPGIDIWTNEKGTGLEGSKGYPVYAACGGKVTRIFVPNQEIEIICDRISEDYRDIVPSLYVKSLYSHMGDAVTFDWFHELKLGQRVEQGEFIGYQGNVSSFAPWNRVTHLHFGIYDLNQSGRPPLDPTPYIGVPTNKVGQVFKENH